MADRWTTRLRSPPPPPLLPLLQLLLAASFLCSCTVFARVTPNDVMSISGSSSSGGGAGGGSSGGTHRVLASKDDSQKKERSDEKETKKAQKEVEKGEKAMKKEEKKTEKEEKKEAKKESKEEKQRAKEERKESKGQESSPPPSPPPPSALLSSPPPSVPPFPPPAPPPVPQFLPYGPLDNPASKLGTAVYYAGHTQAADMIMWGLAYDIVSRNPSEPYTLFVPTNQAYATTYPADVGALGSGSAYQSYIVSAKLLEYHVSTQKIDAAALTSGSQLAPPTWQSMLPGESFKTAHSAGVTQVLPTRGEAATVTQVELYNDGQVFIVHVIDRVLSPALSSLPPPLDRYQGP